MSGQSPCTESFVTPALLVPVVLFTVLATLATGLRIYAVRKVKANPWRHADLYLLLVGLAFAWGGLIQLIAAAAIGGVNCTKIPVEQYTVLILKVQFSNAFLIALASGFTKLSILQFYRRILATKASSFDYICWVMIALVSIWIISQVIVTFTSADPVSSLWSAGGYHERINEPVYIQAIVGSSIVLDLLTLCIPIPLIARLQMRRAKKIKVLAIFWLGAFVVVCSSVRFYYVHTESSGQQASGGSVYNLVRNQDLWSRLEAVISVIVACLPTYGPITFHGRLVESIIRSVRSLRSLGSQGSGESSENATRLQDLSRRRTSQNAQNTVASALETYHEVLKQDRINSDTTAVTNSRTGDEGDAK